MCLPEYEIICSYTRQQIKFVLTFTQNDLTSVEIYTVVLHCGLDTCQTGIRTGQH